MPSPPVTPLEKLLLAHDKALAKLTVAERRRMLAALDQERRAIRAQIRSIPLVTPADLPVRLGRLNLAIVSLNRSLGVVVASSEAKALDLSLDHVGRLWFLQSGSMAGVDAMQLRVAARLARYRSLGLAAPSVEGLSSLVKTQIQNQLVAGAVQGISGSEVAKRVSAAAPIATARANLIVQMEMNRAYNHVAVEVAEDLGWTRRIVEVIDKNNHPFSRAADGAQALPGRNFKVPRADVEAAALAMGRPAGAILWRLAGAFYVGATLPAHYGERGRVVPWNPAWP